MTLLSPVLTKGPRANIGQLRQNRLAQVVNVNQGQHHRRHQDAQIGGEPELCGPFALESEPALFFQLVTGPLYDGRTCRR
jgi:hypothetical protein